MYTYIYIYIYTYIHPSPRNPFPPPRPRLRAVHSPGPKGPGGSRPTVAAAGSNGAGDPPPQARLSATWPLWCGTPPSNPFPRPQNAKYAKQYNEQYHDIYQAI